jgi:hypothetical protein
VSILINSAKSTRLFSRSRRIVARLGSMGFKTGKLLDYHEFTGGTLLFLALHDNKNGCKIRLNPFSPPLHYCIACSGGHCIPAKIATQALDNFVTIAELKQN